jgi:anti-anti-sigma factor
MTAQFRLSEKSGDPAPVVTVTGEIDLANADEFQAVLTDAAADSQTITVDLSLVSYCDSAAIRALFSAAADAKLHLVVPARGPITTLLGICGLDRVATITVTD